MGTVNVLIVEDNKAVALTMKVILAQQGYNVSGMVSSGEEAVESTKSKSLDLILMNIRLNGHMDGVEAARAIRKFSGVPIVFVSGYDSTELIERAKETGNSDYVVKPFTIKHLLEVVAHALVDDTVVYAKYHYGG